MDVSSRPCNSMQCNYATNLISWRAAETTGPGPVDRRLVAVPRTRRRAEAEAEAEHLRLRLVVVPSCAVCTPHPRFKNPEAQRSSEAQATKKSHETEERAKQAATATTQTQRKSQRPNPFYPESRWQVTILGDSQLLFPPSAANCQALREVGD